MEEISVESVPKNRKYSWSFMTAILALLLAIAVTIVAVVYMHNIKTLLKGVNENNQLTQQQIRQLQGIQIKLMNRVNQQGTQLAKNQQLATGNQKAWVMAEVNYLVRLVNYNLNYSRDINAAIALLQAADGRIAQLNDPTLNQVRQQLANNITALGPASKMDLVGILTKIAALQLQIKQLPLITPPTFRQAKTTESMDQPATMWRKALERSLATLKSLVIVRHRQEPVEPLLDVEQLHYLQQNLQLQLQQAQWAVMHGQQKIYQNSLQTTLKWIQDYFASASPQTSAFIQNLQQLQKINIEPSLPDMNPLLNALAQANSPAAKNTEE